MVLWYNKYSKNRGKGGYKIAKDTTKTYNQNSLWYNTEYGYDLNNNVTRLVYRMPQRGVINKYIYTDDNLLSRYDINDARRVDYTYDLLNRLTQTSLTTESPIITSYSYMGSERGNNYTTNKLLSETIDGVTYYYDYDANGNIIEISDSNNTLYTYEYDPMQQLTEVWDYARSKRYRYDYDLAGNITYEIIDTLNSQGVPISSLVNNYQYGDNNWKDKLTSYKGQTITYDEIGNPLQYRDGMTMTWKNGRQLSSLQNGNNSVSYNYDSNSVRVSKNVNNTEYKYVYLNGLLLFESRGQAKFYYSYDANGILYSVKYTLTDASDLLTYYFTHNSRGDIVGIYNGAGELRAHYEYDAWGNVISVTDENNTAITNPNHIGNLNPFRYRGYYLDSETGLYYLMSRYYDPVTHRFANIDGYFQSGTGVLDSNMSTYCRNNPINLYDPTGTMECPIHHEYWEPTCYICRPENAKYISKYNSKSMVDITDKLNNAMENNSNYLENIVSSYPKNNTGYSVAAIIFVNNVRPMGIWDYKSQDDWGLNSDQYYIYEDRIFGFDDIGNVHYGYVGRVLFSESMLLKAGGGVQILTGTSDLGYWNSNFDDPRDQYMISYGVNLWDQAHSK